MATKTIDTTDAYTKLICTTSSELIGDYPNIKFRIHYNLKIKLTAYGSWYYNGADFWFHNTHHSVNLNLSFGSGGGTTGVLASGYIDLPISGVTTKHAPGFGCSGPFTASSTITESQTIATGTMTANLDSCGHDSAVINIALTSPRNYWYARIYNANTESWAISSASNGKNTISGLSPGTSYTFNVEMWSRSGSTYTKQIKISVTTTGFSYLDGNVTNTIGNAISFKVKTYSDNFSTRVSITYGSNNLCTNDIVSSGKVYNFSYQPSEEQLSAIYNTIPNSLATNGTITLTTYINGVAIGSKSYTIKYNVDQNSSKPTIVSFDYDDIVQSSIDKTGNSKWVLQKVSKLQIKNIVANAKNAASITSYRVSIGNNVVNSTTSTINVNSVVEENTGIYLTVIDSRGLQSTEYMDFVRFIQYSSPYFTKIELRRTNDVEEVSSLTVEGSFNPLTIDGIDKNTSILFKYRYRESDSSTWSEYITKELTIDGNKLHYSNVIGNFDTGTTYVFELYVSDYFYSCVNQDMLMKGSFELFIGDGYVEVNGFLDLTNCKLRIGSNEFDAKYLLYDED